MALLAKRYGVEASGYHAALERPDSLAAREQVFHALDELLDTVSSVSLA